MFYFFGAQINGEFNKLSEGYAGQLKTNYSNIALAVIRVIRIN